MPVDLPPIVITQDPGGSIGARVVQIAALRASGRPVVIDGPCMSACTLYAALPKVCSTSRARFGFHAAWRYGPNQSRIHAPEGTDLLMSMYPPGIRRWIASKGGLGAELIWMSAREVQRHVPKCGGETRSARAERPAKLFTPSRGYLRYATR